MIIPTAIPIQSDINDSNGFKMFNQCSILVPTAVPIPMWGLFVSVSISISTVLSYFTISEVNNNQGVCYYLNYWIYNA